MQSSFRFEILESRTLASAVRVLPLGDSITSGSSDNQSEINAATGPRFEQTQTAGGYRRFLKYDLSKIGVTIDYVGNIRHTVSPSIADTSDPLYNVSGVNHIASSSLVDDPESAGFPGYPIINDADPGNLQIVGDNLAKALAGKPDVILVHAGTNDLKDSDVSKQVADFGVMLNQIYAAVPGVKVIVAPLIPRMGGSNVAQFNRGIHDLVRAAAAAGRSIVWAGHMASALSQDSSGSPDFRSDLVHPNLLGYSKMAKVFADALTATPQQLVAPRGFDFKDASPFKDNFYSGYGGAVKQNGSDGGVLRFADASNNTLRFGATLYDPSDTGGKAFGDTTVTADFRTSAANCTFGVYLRVGAADTGGYLGRVSIDSSGTTDVAGIFKNLMIATPAYIPADSAKASAARLTTNTWYTMRFNASNTSDGKGVTLHLDVYPRGQTNAAPAVSLTWTDRDAPYLTAGQAGLRFGTGPAGARVDADNLSINGIATVAKRSGLSPSAFDRPVIPAAGWAEIVGVAESVLGAGETNSVIA